MRLKTMTAGTCAPACVCRRSYSVRRFALVFLLLTAASSAGFAQTKVDEALQKAREDFEKAMAWKQEADRISETASEIQKLLEAVDLYEQAGRLFEETAVEYRRLGPLHVSAGERQEVRNLAGACALAIGELEPLLTGKVEAKPKQGGEEKQGKSKYQPIKSGGVLVSTSY